MEDTDGETSSACVLGSPRPSIAEARANNVTQWIRESLPVTWKFCLGSFSFPSFRSSRPEINFLPTTTPWDPSKRSKRGQTHKRPLNAFFIEARVGGATTARLTVCRWGKISQRAQSNKTRNAFTRIFGAQRETRRRRRRQTGRYSESWLFFPFYFFSSSSSFSFPQQSLIQLRLRFLNGLNVGASI